MFTTLALAAALSATSPSPDRALVAMPAPAGGVYLSWRLLKSDAPEMGFDVYRVQGGTATKINSRSITTTTDFVDPSGNLATYDYYVAPTGTSQRTPLAQESINDNIFAANYTTSVHGRMFSSADLDGDGRDDYVIRYATNDMDPALGNWRLVNGSFSLTAFTRDGTTLWRYRLGSAIEQGIWYSPYAVHDLNGDGRAELIVKAGDESLPLSEIQDETGRVTKGPEYLRILDGRDGSTILAQVNWPSRTDFGKTDPPGTPINRRQYDDYNYYSRNFIAIGYLDGKTPHVIVNRGTYGKHKVAAYTYSAGKLSRKWAWENVNPSKGGNRSHWGQGAHSLQAIDIDGDGRDEVVLGSLILNGDGTPRFTLNHGHRDHLDHVYIGDLHAGNPGLEMYYASEWGHDKAGAGMIDLDTGKPIWTTPWRTEHLHGEGMCADIDARYPGVECYSAEYDKSKYWLMSATGAIISNESLGGFSPLTAWWDSDAQKELISKGDFVNSVLKLSNYPERDYRHVLPLPQKGTLSYERHALTLLAVADVLGDWREELIVADRSRLLFYVSDVPARSRNTWLMQDRMYRMGVTNSSSGYYQQPLLGRPISGR